LIIEITLLTDITMSKSLPAAGQSFHGPIGGMKGPEIE
jgi:hypothetical protein